MPHKCTDCVNYEHNMDCDDHYVTAEWVECKARPALANLKQFPFRKTACAAFKPRKP